MNGRHVIANGTPITTIPYNTGTIHSMMVRTTTYARTVVYHCEIYTVSTTCSIGTSILRMYRYTIP